MTTHPAPTGTFVVWMDLPRVLGTRVGTVRSVGGVADRGEKRLQIVAGPDVVGHRRVEAGEIGIAAAV